jgi:phosphonate transport system substrate-binding protein
MNIRQAISMAALGVALAAGSASAETWRDKYPELVFAMVPAENATGTMERYAPFVDYQPSIP